MNRVPRDGPTISLVERIKSPHVFLVEGKVVHVRVGTDARRCDGFGKRNIAAMMYGGKR